MPVRLFGAFVFAVIVLSGCGGGSGSSASTDGSGLASSFAFDNPNAVKITVEKWSASSNYPNQAFVSLEICQPQTTNCQTIPHILVDTGSYGLRLVSSSISIPLTQTQINNGPLAECAHFISGFTWGGIYNADVKLANQTAPAVPIQVIDGNYAQIPSSCSSGGGPAMNTQSVLGANGILGIGSFQQDCPSCALRAVAARYYVCSTLPCSPTAVALSAQVTNPVAMLPTNDNGVVISLQSVDPIGQISAVGTLVFGIDTNASNSITSESVFKLDANGYLTTTYAGRAYTQSFIDSGSNGLFFTDYTLTRCSYSVGFYCPSSDLTKTATISSGGTSKTVTFKVGSAEALSSSYAVQPNLAGMGSSFDWGLPFFYGRKVFVSISGKSVQGGTTPIVAF
jgi:hypothetical protein